MRSHGYWVRLGGFLWDLTQSVKGHLGLLKHPFQTINKTKPKTKQTKKLTAIKSKSSNEKRLPVSCHFLPPTGNLSSPLQGLNLKLTKIQTWFWVLVAQSLASALLRETGGGRAMSHLVVSSRFHTQLLLHLMYKLIRPLPKAMTVFHLQSSSFYMQHLVF